MTSGRFVAVPQETDELSVSALDADSSEPVSDAAQNDGGQDAAACYPLFRACTSRVPIDAGSCLAGFGSATDGHCVDLFTCNLLMGTCPPDVMPGVSVISCR